MEKESDAKERQEQRQLEEAGLSAQEISVILRYRKNLNRSHTTAETRDIFIMITLALVSAVLVRVVLLYDHSLTEATTIRFLLPAILTPVSLYLCRALNVSLLNTILLTGALILLPLASSWYPETEARHTAMLAALHLPVIMLFLILKVCARSLTGRTSRAENLNGALALAGEIAIFAVLAMTGWLVLTGIFSLVMEQFGLDSNMIVETWLIPSGFSALLTVSAFVSLSRYHDGQTAITSLATLFVPLVDLLLVVLIATRILTAGNDSNDRDLLILIDVILILVICLVLISPVRRKRTVFFYLEVILIASALVLDLTALLSISTRLVESGMTPNKGAALGLNMLIFIHLCYLGIAYLGNTDDNRIILRAKTRFLPLYALWSVVVVYVFPFLFSFS